MRSPRPEFVCLGSQGYNRHRIRQGNSRISSRDWENWQHIADSGLDNYYQISRKDRRFQTQSLAHYPSTKLNRPRCFQFRHKRLVSLGSKTRPPGAIPTAHLDSFCEYYYSFFPQQRRVLCFTTSSPNCQDHASSEP